MLSYGGPAGLSVTLKCSDGTAPPPHPVLKCDANTHGDIMAPCEGDFAHKIRIESWFTPAVCSSLVSGATEGGQVLAVSPDGGSAAGTRTAEAFPFLAVMGGVLALALALVIVGVVMAHHRTAVATQAKPVTLHNAVEFSSDV